MFCQNCGAETAQELSYCKRCGANLNIALAPRTELAQVSLTKPIVAIGLLMTIITLGGFILLITGASELARSVGLSSDPVIVLVALGMIMITVIDILLAVQMSRIVNHALEAGKTAQPKKFTSNTQPPLQMPAPTQQPIPVSSITENTTRTLATPHKESGF